MQMRMCRSPMTSLDAETDSKPIIIIIVVCRQEKRYGNRSRDRPVEEVWSEELQVSFALLLNVCSLGINNP